MPDLSDALFSTTDHERNITDAAESIAYQLKCLGTGDAATNMGAIEALALEIRNGSESIASALMAIAEAISNH